MKRSITAILLTAFTLMASVAYGQTQGSDNITATTTVVSQITVTGVQGLNFGNITATSSSAVGPSNGSAGHFQVQGVASLGVSLSLTLPNASPGTTGYAYALDSGDTGATDVNRYLELSFVATDGEWVQGQNGAAGTGTAFNPTTGATPTLGGDGYLEVYVGGTATASAGQPDGAYTGDITLTVDYTE